MASWFPEEGGQTPVCTLHELGPVSNHLYVAHTFPHPTQPSCNVFPLPRPSLPPSLPCSYRALNYAPHAPNPCTLDCFYLCPELRLWDSFALVPSMETVPEWVIAAP